MKLLIICGETSANIYGSKLANELTALGHDVYSFGDAQLAQKTHQLLRIAPTYHSVGTNGGFRKRKLINKISSLIDSSQIVFNKAIIIDFPGYNFKIAELFTSKNIPIVSYITPNFWLWNQKKLAKKLLGYSSLVITIFKKEFDFYRQFDDRKVVYHGHPLSLTHHLTQYSPGPPFRIGIYPGSRRSEINDHLPVFLSIMSILKKDPQNLFYIICSNSDLHPLILDHLNRSKVHDIPILKRDNDTLSYALSVPGTNTFRLALLGIPLTIIGQLHYLSYFIVKYILRIKLTFIALPNIILNRKVVPEYVQVNSETLQVANEITQILNSTDKIQTIRNDLSTIKEVVQAPSDYWRRIAGLISE